MRSTVRPVLAALAVTAALGCFPQEVSAADPAKSADGAGGPAPADAATTGAAAASTGAVPRPDHVVVVVMENRSLSEIIGNPAGAVHQRLRSRWRIVHPVVRHTPPQPAQLPGAVLRLHTGADRRLLPAHLLRSRTSVGQLLDARRTFAGYSEGLPSPGSTACTPGALRPQAQPVGRTSRTVPAVGQPAVQRVPDATTPRCRPCPSWSPTSTTTCTTARSRRATCGCGTPRRLRRLGPTHNSLLVLTWDEDDRSESNRILTVVAGAHVRPGRYAERIDHYRLLRTLEALEGSAAVGQSISATPVTSIWTP